MGEIDAPTGLADSPDELTRLGGRKATGSKYCRDPATATGTTTWCSRAVESGPSSHRSLTRREAGLSVVDKRSELASFDPEEGYRSIGVTMSRPPRRREPASGHVMY